MSSGAARRGLPAAGIFAGPIAWLVSTQVNYSLTPWSCAHQLRIVPLVALALAAASLVGGWVSWRALRNGLGAAEPPDGGRPRDFLALVGVGMSLIFAAVILLHGTAGLMLDGCWR